MAGKLWISSVWWYKGKNIFLHPAERAIFYDGPDRYFPLYWEAVILIQKYKLKRKRPRWNIFFVSWKCSCSCRTVVRFIFWVIYWCSNWFQRSILLSHRGLGKAIKVETIFSETGPEWKSDFVSGDSFEAGKGNTFLEDRGENCEWRVHRGESLIWIWGCDKK